MDRREFSRVAGLGIVGIASACLDPRTVDGPPLAPAPPILRASQTLPGGAGSVAVSPWPNGADAGVLVSADDLCPVNLGSPYDFGALWGNAGTSGGPVGDVESFVLGLLDTYPLLRFSFNTITAMRYDPRTNGALDRSYPLSSATDWLARLQEIQNACPGFVVGWHGHSHYNAQHGGPAEFGGYDPVQTRGALDAMEAEGGRSGLRFTRAFRPPGWVLTPTLVEELAARRYVLCDNSRLSTWGGVLPSYTRTAAGNWLFRMGVTFDLTAAQTFAQGGLFEAHHHLTPPNVNTLTDPAIRDRLTRFLDTWYRSTDPLLAWLSTDEVQRAYSDAATVQWVSSVDGRKVSITILNPASLVPGITWVVTSNVITDVEILANGVKLALNINERASGLKATLTA